MKDCNIIASRVSKEFVVILKKFFVPFGNRAALLLVLLVAALLAGWLDITTGARELVRQNSKPTLLMLASEVKNEAGPFVRASGKHAQLLRKYVRHMERRPFSLVVRWLYPEYSPRKQLSSIVLALESAPNDEEGSKEVINAAGDQLYDFYKTADKFSDRPIVWFKSERLPNWLVNDINSALVNSHTMVETLGSELSVECALGTCEANREAILLLCLARLGYNDEEKIKAFLGDVKQAQKFTAIVANKKGNEQARDQILKWAESEARRVKILQARLAKNMDEVERLLRETIEKSI